MLDVHTLLTTLASSTNRSYARWKALLSYHPSQMALILEYHILNQSLIQYMIFESYDSLSDEQNLVVKQVTEPIF